MEIFINSEISRKTKRMIEKVLSGMSQGLNPSLAFDGTAGTYMMKDFNKNTAAIFKPIDEEAYAPNNPRGYIGEFGQSSFRKGVLSGEGVIREVASFLLDHDHFSGVPETIFAEAMHPSFNYSSSQEMDDTNFDSSKDYNNMMNSLINPRKSEQSSDSTNAGNEKDSPGCEDSKMKYGSLQYFVKADDVASNFCSDLFSTSEVHKIGILDLRMMNLDRNDGNILVRKDKKGFELIPIDHSLSIPDNLEIYSYDICWMDWGQSEQPFKPHALEYIEKIDVLKDVKMLDNIFKFRKI